LKNPTRREVEIETEKTEHEAQHIPPVGAHIRIRIDQEHPIRLILHSTGFITDHIGTSSHLWKR